MDVHLVMTTVRVAAVVSVRTAVPDAGGLAVPAAVERVEIGMLLDAFIVVAL
jgi:hypothetical protein